MEEDSGTMYSLIGAAVLVALSGLFSGLNLGLMSFTDDDLGVVIRGSDDLEEIAHARAIQPVRRRGNLLLCTLLLGNTLVNAVIAVLLSDLTSGLVGTLVTTGLIVVFGEIIPQSLCSRHALAIGAAALPLVQVFIAICYPLAYPISLLLDWLLGREVSAVFSRHGLLALVRLQVESEVHAQESGLTPADAKVISGALTFQDTTVADVMTPLEHVFSLPLSAKLDKTTIVSVVQRGHTRVPVYEGRADNIVSLLFCKDMLGIGFERELSLSAVLESFGASARVRTISGHCKLNEALDYCKRERVHMLIVVSGEADDDGGARGGGGARAIGIVTMEDFLEEILQEEIVDETDVYVHNQAASTKAMVSAATFAGRLSARSQTQPSEGEGDPPSGQPVPSQQLRPALRSRSRAARLAASKPSFPKMNSRVYDMAALLNSLGGTSSAAEPPQAHRGATGQGPAPPGHPPPGQLAAIPEAGGAAATTTTAGARPKRSPFSLF